MAAAFALLAFATCPALAAVGHKPVGTLREAASGIRLGEGDAVAVDHATGQVLVGDATSGTVDVFGSADAFEVSFGSEPDPVGVAVAEGRGLVYVADSVEDAVDVFKRDGSGFVLLSQWHGAGTPEGGFGEVSGVAVDNSSSASDPRAGDVYVSDGGDNSVYVFRPYSEGGEEAREGAYAGALKGGKLEEPNGVTVNSATGQVFVADSERGVVDVYGASGAFERKVDGAGSPLGSFLGSEGEEGNVSGVAVDEATGNVFVAEGERRIVSEFNSGGEWIGWLTEDAAGEAFSEPHGVAVGVGGEVFVADPLAGLVSIFGPDVIVPDAKTQPASQVGKTTTTLNGVIDGDGKAASYSFQWGTTPALGNRTAVVHAAGTGEEPVSGTLGGLAAASTYYFRFVTENEDGRNYGAVREFTTTSAVASLLTGGAEALTQSAGRLTGTLNPAGYDTHYWFEWGTTSAYGQKTPVVDAGAGTKPVIVQAALAGLVANTIYHYRLVGEDSLGVTVGQDRTFATAGPPRITYQPPAGVTHEGATLHARVNPDEINTSYRFEYGPTTSYGSETPVGGASVGAGDEPVVEAATLTGLQIGTVYHYRVVAENSDGERAVGRDETLETIPAAPIDTEYTTAVTPSEATLNTEVNPLGHTTTYYFQYGSQACEQQPAACTDIPTTPEDIGAGEQPLERSQHLTGLTPSATYHYRVIASNELGTTTGPEHTFTTRPEEGPPTTPPTLPDGRAWEMVTPPDKQGAPVEAQTYEGGTILASEDGDALAYVANGALGQGVEGNRSPEWQQMLARRGEKEWHSQDIATANLQAEGINAERGPEYELFNENLSEALVEPFGPPPDPPLVPGVTQRTFYVRNDENGSYLPVVYEGDVAPGAAFSGAVRVVNATPDLSHIVFSSAVPLLGADSTSGLYEWTAGVLTQVSVLPDGAPATGRVQLGYSNDITTAISAEGSRVVWSTVEETPELGHLYMRDTATGRTVQLDAAQGVAEPAGPGKAEFQGASADGSRVFFTDRQRLTPEATPDPVHEKPDLYECEMIEAAPGQLECKLTDLTVDRNEEEHADVQGLILGTSETGEVAYFVALGVLAENENADGQTAVAGGDNLYEARYQEGSWSTSFVGTLASTDSPEWEGNQPLANTAFVTARVSPNGRYFAFMSAADLTGYDNVEANPEADGARAEEVFLYDADTNGLRCVSCDPSGERPSGVLDRVLSGEGLGLVVDRRKVWVGHWLAGNIPGWTAESLTRALVQARYLSNEGRLFFNSPEDLVPAAKNHTNDVYEYEPAGVGSCESATGGCVALLSSGTAEKESAFIEATPTASDVFFLTQARLLPQDTDTAFDIYDARECTATSPCLTPPSSPATGCNDTQACRPAPPAAQPAGVSASSPSAPGNLAPATEGYAKKEVRGAKTQGKPSLTRAQKLARALKQCRTRHPRSKKKRRACVRHARREFGQSKKKQSKKKK